MATFLLVHGTFAKSAHWPALQKGLAEAAHATGETAYFKQLPWSAKTEPLLVRVPLQQFSNQCRIFNPTPTMKRNLPYWSQPRWERYCILPEATYGSRKDAERLRIPVNAVHRDAPEK